MFFKTIKIHIAYCLLLLTASLANAAEAAITTNNDLGLFQQGLQFSVDGEWSNAEKIFRGIAERNPSWPEPKNNLAVALYKTGKIEQSQLAFEDAVTSLPSFKVAQLNRQRLYDYSASLAYNRAVGNNNKPRLPILELLNDVTHFNKIDTRSNQKLNDSPDNAHKAFEQVKDSLLKWSHSWAETNVDAYLSSYSSHFIPSGHFKSFTHWLNNRKAKFSKQNIEHIKLASIQIFIDNDKKQALTQFVQNYKSNNYQDKVLKQVLFAYTNDRWLIVSEQVLKDLN